MEQSRTIFNACGLQSTGLSTLVKHIPVNYGRITTLLLIINQVYGEVSFIIWYRNSKHSFSL